MTYFARENQPLTEHLKEVSTLAKMFGQTFGAEHTAELAGLLHDFGKYTQAFQDYLNGNNGKRGEVIHAYQGAKYVLDTFNERLVAGIIADAVVAHHNCLDNSLDGGIKPLDIKTDTTKKKLDYDNAQSAFLLENTINENASDLCCHEVKRVLEICKTKNLQCRFMLHLWTKVLYSCLVDADRCNAAGLAGKVITPDWNDYLHRLQEHLTGFDSDTPIKKARQRFSEQCGQAGNREQGVYTLSLPTGGGKTLSSLRFALKHAEKHKLERIIYVIPYLSILDQTVKNIREALKEPADRPFILEHHSNAVIERDRTSEEQDEAEEKLKLLTSRWDSPFILTTMVQFLETIYSNKASQLRKFHNIGKSVIIFDEIQSLPIKCVHLFNDAVNFLHTFGQTTVLLCTATQPHLHKVEGRPVKLTSEQSLVSLTDDERKCFGRTVVKNEIRELDNNELADLVEQQLENKKSVLVILNTKSDVKRLYETCKDFNCRKVFLTTNLCPAHRLDVLEQLKPSQELTLCVSTQLIEAGVDISFGCVIRALAGLDSIVQAAGRCNRNGENPVPQEVIVVKLKGENLQRLKEIKEGQEQTERVCREIQNENLLCEDAINLFYKYYFFEQQRDGKMEYRYSKNEPTIYNLSNKNDQGVEAYKEITGKDYKLKDGLSCAFKTAAEHFSVIDSKQTGIVVPYGNVAELVRQFRDIAKQSQKEYNPKEMSRLLKEKNRLLKQLQPFTVSVYEHTLTELTKRKALEIIGETFYYLSDTDYYDTEKLGLLTVSMFSPKII